MTFVGQKVKESSCGNAAKFKLQILISTPKSIEVFLRSRAKYTGSIISVDQKVMKSLSGSNAQPKFDLDPLTRPLDPKTYKGPSSWDQGLHKYMWSHHWWQKIAELLYGNHIVYRQTDRKISETSIPQKRARTFFQKRPFSKSMQCVAILYTLRNQSNSVNVQCQPVQMLCHPDWSGLASRQSHDDLPSVYLQRNFIIIVQNVNVQTLWRNKTESLMNQEMHKEFQDRCWVM